MSNDPQLPNKPRHFYKTLTDSIELKETMLAKAFQPNTKKFFYHLLTGWFSSIRKDLSPEGVNKIRIVDRRNNFYKEKVVDAKTGRVIRAVEEKLTDHK